MIEPGKNGRRSGSVAKGRCEASCFVTNGRPLVRWILTDHNSRKPALGGAAETASQSTVQSSVHRAVAGKLPGLSVASLTDGEGNGRPRHLPGDSGGSLPTAVFPLPLPLGNPRSSI